MRLHTKLIHRAPAHKGFVFNIPCLAHAGLKDAIVCVAQLQSLMRVLAPSTMIWSSPCSQSNWPVDTNVTGDTSTGAANQRKETEIGVHSTLDGPVEAKCPRAGKIQRGGKAH